MTPAEWLAALLLGWVLGAGLWQAVDNPVYRRYDSYFYLLVTTSVEVALVILALVVLNAAAVIVAVAAVVMALSVIGVIHMIAIGKRTL